MDRIIKRGDIYYANLNPIIGSEQGGTRPVLIISNDILYLDFIYVRKIMPRQKNIWTIFQNTIL